MTTSLQHQPSEGGQPAPLFEKADPGANAPAPSTLKARFHAWLGDTYRPSLLFAIAFILFSLYTPAWVTLALNPPFWALSLIFAHHPFFNYDLKRLVVLVTLQPLAEHVGTLLERDCGSDVRCWLTGQEAGPRGDTRERRYASWALLAAVAFGPALFLLIRLRLSARRSGAA